MLLNSRLMDRSKIVHGITHEMRDAGMGFGQDVVEVLALLLTDSHGDDVVSWVFFPESGHCGIPPVYFLCSSVSGYRALSKRLFLKGAGTISKISPSPKEDMW